ncbi:Mediator of RNA polymerase II transcription subunit 7 [Kickxella alabastrina]|uniref:Mediator of RNA polymerase II transcription subunit 7 n=1 Tax=Kickxella alabastrina TaxID=61397 RepID=A0ACC1IV82_9FUNG|nr:Mediator of RNA polymerase II transcription subunit 7 [Kickxella alabastrina]
MPDESQQGAQQLDASYPAPPDYFALFTDENIARLQSTNQDALPDHGSAGPWLDPVLKYLMPPPPPPASASYSNFGRMWHVTDRLPTLAEQKIPQLYPDGPINRIAELVRLNHSVVFEFLDLVDVLIKDPSLFAARTERIRDIFVNIHHLINEYRGHQAKESLKRMLRQQIESKRTASANVLQKCEALEQTIARLKLDAAAMQANLTPPDHSLPPPLPNDDATTTAKGTSSLAAVPSSPGSHAHVADSGLNAIIESIQGILPA